MKRCAVVLSLMILMAMSQGCGRRMGLFGLRGARCGMNCAPPAATLGAPLVGTATSGDVISSDPCANGQCVGPAIISASPSSGATYGYGGTQGELLPDAASSFESASMGLDTVFSRVVSDRKLKAEDGKLPEPKLDN